MTSRQKTIIALSIVPQVLVIKGLSFFPELIETVYSNGIYRGISMAMRLVFGWIPFSFGDVVYTVLGLYAIRWVIRNFRRIRRDTKFFFRDVLVAVSIAYFAFHLLWGFNYYRLPLHNSIQLDNEYSTEELTLTIDLLTSKANDVHSSLSESDTLAVEVPYTKGELLKMSSIGFEKLTEEFPDLNPTPKSLKRSIYSIPLTYMGFSGYLNPFTNESQVDGLIPKHNYPVTACHEQAHQIGYAAENEANFIGFLAAVKNDDPYFQYSAYIFALKHCLFELSRRDESLFESKWEAINKGILKNYEESRLFWMSYQNPLEPIFKETFNTFLKANSQTAGIRSYSYVVALLVNYFETDTGIQTLKKT